MEFAATNPSPDIGRSTARSLDARNEQQPLWVGKFSDWTKTQSPSFYATGQFDRTSRFSRGGVL